MPDDVSIVPFSPAYAAAVEAWTGQTAVHTLLKLPPIGAEPNNTYGWVALKDGQPVGVVTINQQGSPTGYLTIVVKPTEQRQGVGGQLMAYALAQPAVQALTHLRAQIDRDNIGAQKILNQEGFSQTGFTDDGRLEFEKH